MFNILLFQTCNADPYLIVRNEGLLDDFIIR